MRDRPDGPALLALAERIEAGDPAIAVPEAGRYRDLMIARARAIAERQAVAGAGRLEDERKALSEILGRDGDLATLNRAVMAEIRTGRFDPGRDGAEAVRDLLWRAVTARVAESNPKALKS